MAFEMVVGLSVADEEKYSEYRKHMLPLLQQHGGGFRYDFLVSRTLQPASAAAINRVFLIYFRDEPAKDAFFSHPEYKTIKDTYFAGSVGETTILSAYSRD